jgi:hypothetical protein
VISFQPTHTINFFILKLQPLKTSPENFIKKYFILFCLQFFFSQLSFAQQATFERFYDTLGVVSAGCVQETFDGGYVVCGVRWDNINFENDAAIMKLDSLGNIIWVKTFSKNSQSNKSLSDQSK